MSAVSDVVQRLQSGILELAPSTVHVIENVTQINTNLLDVWIQVVVKELKEENMHESYRGAGLVGILQFVSAAAVCVREDVDTYRKIFSAVDDWGNGAWARQTEATPKGYLATGLIKTVNIHDPGVPSKEVLMNDYEIFANDAHVYSMFVKSSLRFKDFK